jgi:hypothetical protein
MVCYDEVQIKIKCLGSKWQQHKMENVFSFLKSLQFSNISRNVNRIQTVVFNWKVLVRYNANVIISQCK